MNTATELENWLRKEANKRTGSAESPLRTASSSLFIPAAEADALAAPSSAIVAEF